MKQHIEQLLRAALQSLLASDQLPASIHVEYTRDKQHGDFASNVALVLAKTLQMPPRTLAEKIITQLPKSSIVQQVTLAGPGFINFFLAPHAWQRELKTILDEGEQYGHAKKSKNQKIHLEFVSANPTGPLHVGHGRGAAYGGALADLLDSAGFLVHREYYVNDGGRQMDILATSVWLRYLEICGETFTFPSNGYKGEYILAIAQQLKATYGEQFHQPVSAVFKDLPLDEPQGGDKEVHIDALIQRAKTLLGPTEYHVVFNMGLADILNDIRADLAEFGIHYQAWFSERSLIENGAVDRAVEKLKNGGHAYEQEGALWFRSTAFGDDKDRVLIRENGQPTYFAVDAAYRLNILERGFSKLINILGADHHGYVPRIRAVIQAFGYDPAVLTVLLVQFAVLYRGKERVQMSTRSGSFVTLRELREEVGTDAARFFYVMRRCEQHMDFDLELAKSASNDNPVYYLQYAHARICSVMRQAADKQFVWKPALAYESLALLDSDYEIALLKELLRYPEIVEFAAINYEPHLIAHYLREVANAFHAYYNALPFLVEDEKLRNARLALILATRYVLANGLKLLGVSAPELM
jgi:arginyl-tRNA synthetase